LQRCLTFLLESEKFMSLSTGSTEIDFGAAAVRLDTMVEPSRLPSSDVETFQDCAQKFQAVFGKNKQGRILYGKRRKAVNDASGDMKKLKGKPGNPDHFKNQAHKIVARFMRRALILDAEVGSNTRASYDELKGMVNPTIFHDALVEKARFYLGKNDYKNAVKLYEEALDVLKQIERPRNVEVLLYKNNLRNELCSAYEGMKEGWLVSTEKAEAYQAKIEEYEGASNRARTALLGELRGEIEGQKAADTPDVDAISDAYNALIDAMQKLKIDKRTLFGTYREAGAYFEGIDQADKSGEFFEKADGMAEDVCYMDGSYNIDSMSAYKESYQRLLMNGKEDRASTLLIAMQGKIDGHLNDAADRKQLTVEKKRIEHLKRTGHPHEVERGYTELMDSLIDLPHLCFGVCVEAENYFNELGQAAASDESSGQRRKKARHMPKRSAKFSRTADKFRAKADEMALDASKRTLVMSNKKPFFESLARLPRRRDKAIAAMQAEIDSGYFASSGLHFRSPELTRQRQAKLASLRLEYDTTIRELEREIDITTEIPDYQRPVDDWDDRPVLPHRRHHAGGLFTSRSGF